MRIPCPHDGRLFRSAPQLGPVGDFRTEVSIQHSSRSGTLQRLLQGLILPAVALPLGRRKAPGCAGTALWKGIVVSLPNGSMTPALRDGLAAAQRVGFEEAEHTQDAEGTSRFS